MRDSIVFRASRVALFVSAMMVVASVAFSQVDSMAKWKPNVGDKFVYHHTYSYDGIQHPHTDDDTITVLILDNNASIDTMHGDVVIAQWAGQKKYFWFHAAPDTEKSDHPVIVRCSETSSQMEPPYGHFDYYFDFGGVAVPTKSFFQGVTLDLFSTNGGFYACQCGAPVLSYSPELRWFFSETGLTISGPLDEGWSEQWSNQLIQAVTTASRVCETPSYQSVRMEILSKLSTSQLNVEVQFESYRLATLNLLDPLARPIRSWSLDVASGESQVRLNVADVPSGVYFLKLSASGVEEVRKVVIVH